MKGGENMMDLDSAIRHCLEVADGQTEQGRCPECAADHRQLAEWLTDYKRLKEQSGDTISRQAVIDALEKVAELFPWRVPGKLDTYDSYNGTWNDAIGRAEMEIEVLPPVTPQQKMGHWIFDEILDKHYYCSECKSMGVDYWDFCPNCGARMVEPQERSDEV